MVERWAMVDSVCTHRKTPRARAYVWTLKSLSLTAYTSEPSNVCSYDCVTPESLSTFPPLPTIRISPTIRSELRQTTRRERRSGERRSGWRAAVSDTRRRARGPVCTMFRHNYGVHCQRPCDPLSVVKPPTCGFGPYRRIALPNNTFRAPSEREMRCATGGIGKVSEFCCRQTVSGSPESCCLPDYFGHNRSSSPPRVRVT